jgi:hypothetical protein
MCSLCPRSFCFDTIGKEVDPHQQACIAVPASEVDTDRAWPCPECLSQVQARTAPVRAPSTVWFADSPRRQYIINRGARRTMRLATPCAVAVVIFCLRDLQELASSIHQQIQASLGAFEMNISTALCYLHQGLSLPDEQALLDQYALFPPRFSF